MSSVCRLGDISTTTVPDAHGCPACPHPCSGPAVTASGNVWVQGKQALRLGDTGIHAACCGPNTWKVIEASGQVFVNGLRLVRVGDRTQHCGAIGSMTTGAQIVVDGSPPQMGPDPSVQQMQKMQEQLNQPSNMTKSMGETSSSTINNPGSSSPTSQPGASSASSTPGSSASSTPGSSSPSSPSASSASPGGSAPSGDPFSGMQQAQQSSTPASNITKSVGETSSSTIPNKK